MTNLETVILNIESNFINKLSEDDFLKGLDIKSGDLFPLIYIKLPDIYSRDLHLVEYNEYIPTSQELIDIQEWWLQIEYHPGEYENDLIASTLIDDCNMEEINLVEDIKKLVIKVFEREWKNSNRKLSSLYTDDWFIEHNIPKD